jgi:hypothetical protein
VPAAYWLARTCVPGTGECDLGVSISVTPAGHGNKDSISDRMRFPGQRQSRKMSNDVGQGRKRKKDVDTWQLQEREVWPEAQGHSHQRWSLS